MKICLMFSRNFKFNSKIQLSIYLEQYLINYISKQELHVRWSIFISDKSDKNHYSTEFRCLWDTKKGKPVYSLFKFVFEVVVQFVVCREPATKIFIFIKQSLLSVQVNTSLLNFICFYGFFSIIKKGGLIECSKIITSLFMVWQKYSNRLLKVTEKENLR